MSVKLPKFFPIFNDAEAFTACLFIHAVQYQLCIDCYCLYWYTNSSPLQLENDHTLFDYDVGMNHIIQLMVVQELPPGAGDGDPTGSDREENSTDDVSQLQ